MIVWRKQRADGRWSCVEGRCLRPSEDSKKSELFARKAVARFAKERLVTATTMRVSYNAAGAFE